MPQVNCNNINSAFRKWTSGDAFVLNNNVHIWCIDISAHLGLLRYADTILNTDEQGRAGRYHHRHNTERFIVSRVALRFLLGRYLQMAPQEIVFGKGADKKPFIQNAGDSAIQYNVSHSGNKILIAISSKEIGVDVEYIDPAFAFADVLPVCFNDAETLAVGQSRSLFYKFWTRKEAIRKATGKGVDDELPLVPCADGAHTVDTATIGSAQNWSVNSFEIGEQYIASITCHPAVGAVLFHDLYDGLFDSPELP